MMAVRFWTLTIAAYAICFSPPAGELALTLQVSGSEPQSVSQGEVVFRKLCANCHGPQGQGTEHYQIPLAGDKPIVELAALISRTMPEGEPELCVAEDATAVAEYIYHAFYSPLAQVRVRPPRWELSRLTARQYEESVSDLVAQFTGGVSPSAERGLQLELFRGGWADEKKRFESRVVPEVLFGRAQAENLPAPLNEPIPKGAGSKKADEDEVKARQFHVQWSGAVFAPETGLYEFVVESPNGFTLLVNGWEPLIDAAVRSGERTEERADIRLLGGRWYLLRLGVSRTQEDECSAQLRWVRPHGIEEAVPTRYLQPAGGAEQFVLQTSLPDDDRSGGYLRGNQVSPAWIEATAHAALEAGAFVASRAESLAKTKWDAEDSAEQLRAFCLRLAQAAYRRPLTAEEQQACLDRWFAATDDKQLAVRLSVASVLSSPHFLYPVPDFGARDSRAVISRLAISLWDSLPSGDLLKQVHEGAEPTREDVAAWAEQMLQDPRARAKVRDFVEAWLKLDQIRELSKDGGEFAFFSRETAAAMKESLLLFVEEVIWSERSDFRDLFRSPELYVNGHLAPLLNPKADAGAGSDVESAAGEFVRVSFPPEQRAGLLSHPYLMAGFAYSRESSPIHRGVFVARNLLGRELRPPPVAVAPLSPDVTPELTTRERVMLQTDAEACRSCHVMINGLGFSLENFDAIGRFRDEDNGKPVDSTGDYVTTSGDRRQFSGVRDLAEFVADSHESRRAFVIYLFEHLSKQPLAAYGADAADRLADEFAADGFHIQRLIVRMAVMIALPEVPALSAASVPASQP